MGMFVYLYLSVNVFVVWICLYVNICLCGDVFVLGYTLLCESICVWITVEVCMFGCIVMFLLEFVVWVCIFGVVFVCGVVSTSG